MPLLTHATHSSTRQHNRLAKVHACLARCERLETLNVESNEVELIAKAIGNLPRLQFLLVRTPRDAPHAPPAARPALTCLLRARQLAHNRLKELPFDPRRTAAGLRRLTLRGNQLSEAVMQLALDEGEGGSASGAAAGSGRAHSAAARLAEIRGARLAAAPAPAVVPYRPASV